MVVGEIMSAHALVQTILILPVGGSTNNSLCHHLHEKIFISKNLMPVLYILSLLDVTIGLCVCEGEPVIPIATKR
jgi:hypothetical protein